MDTLFRDWSGSELLDLSETILMQMLILLQFTLIIASFIQIQRYTAGGGEAMNPRIKFWYLFLVSTPRHTDNHCVYKRESEPPWD